MQQEEAQKLIVRGWDTASGASVRS